MPRLGLSARQIILHLISQSLYVSRLGMCALRANERIGMLQRCMHMLDATSMQRHSNATHHRATRRQPRQATDECTTLDGQAHLNLARPRQYRAWVSLYKRTLPLMYSLALRFVITCARPSLRIRIPSKNVHSQRRA